MRQVFSRPRWWVEDRARAIVETALMLPILVFRVLAAGDMARGFAVQIAIQRLAVESEHLRFRPPDVDAHGVIAMTKR